MEPILAAKRPGEIDRICLDPSRAKAELGWEQSIPLEEGIGRTVESHRRQGGSSSATRRR
jgi:UDP-glucose 4-epimerase